MVIKFFKLFSLLFLFLSRPSIFLFLKKHREKKRDQSSLIVNNYSEKKFHILKGDFPNVCPLLVLTLEFKRNFVYFCFQKENFFIFSLIWKTTQSYTHFQFQSSWILDIIFRHINAYLFVCSFCVHVLQISNILFYFFSFFYYFIINKLSFDFLSVSSDGDKESERSERIEFMCIEIWFNYYYYHDRKFVKRKDIIRLCRCKKIFERLKLVYVKYFVQWLIYNVQLLFMWWLILKSLFDLLSY